MSEIVQSLWIGDSLSQIEQLTISSYLKNGHEFHLYAYAGLSGVPDGTTLRDANEILPARNIFTVDGSLALFADWFRWKMLFERGGYWVDMDEVCLRPLDFADELVFGKETGDRVAVGMLRFPAGHYVPEAMLGSCEEPNATACFDGPKQIRRKRRRRWLRRGIKGVKWGDIGGPLAFTRALKHFELFDRAKPYTYFYPVACGNWDSIFDETFAGDFGLFADTYAIHLWNEMMRRKSDFDKDGSFPKKALIEYLKRKYLAKS